MEKLESLASITRLSDRVVRVLGQNPGKFTLQGTNTYLIGTHNPYTLVDTGEGREEYIPVLESALREAAPPTNPNQPEISDIILSHVHGDHVGGLPTVLALLRRLWEARNSTQPFQAPRIHKFPLPASASSMYDKLPAIISSLPADSYVQNTAGTAVHDISDGQIFSSPGSTLQVLHTPGHTKDSIALYIPEDSALYTADTVLGQGTAVFEDLGEYLTSLRRLHDRVAENTNTKLYPGHGPVVADGVGALSTYISHRLQREDQIVRVLESPLPLSDAGGKWTLWGIVGSIYAAYPKNLWEPAAHGVQLHLRKLEGEGRVRRVGGEGNEAQWEVVEDKASAL